MQVFIGWVVFFLFLSTSSVRAAEYTTESLCASLLTAHLDESLDVPPGWREIEIELRKKFRSGSVRAGVPFEAAETVMIHTQRLRRAMMVYASKHPDLNSAHAGVMCLVHDLSEALAPDFTPNSKVTKAQKFKIEKKAWKQIIKKVGPVAKPLEKIWLEYEAGKSPEARIAKQLDKLDVVVQALSYERLGVLNGADFFTKPRTHLKDDVFISIYNILLKRMFPLVRVFDQYLFLLSVEGDFDAYKKEMKLREEEMREIISAAKNL